MLITQPLKTALAERGIASAFPGTFHLPDQTVLEPPLSLKRMSTAYTLEMGAFSFAESGYYFGAKIGRYCSIAAGVQIGRGSHPIEWGSTSPLFYQHHTSVFDLDLPQAADFQLGPGRVYTPPKTTTIGNDVRIGHGALISQGVTIHDGAIIEPFTVVTKDVPHFAIVAGNPGVVVGMRFTPPVAARAMHLAWWRYAFWDFSGAPLTNMWKFLDVVKRRIDEGMLPHAPKPVVLTELAAELPVAG